MDKKVFIYIASVMFLLSGNIFAESLDAYRPLVDDTYKDYFQSHNLFIPAGITTNAVLSQEINSNTAIVGQTICAILINDFKYKGILIAPYGSIITGSIVYNRKAGYAGKDAQMQIRFTTIRTPYNNIIPINAIVATKDSSGIIKGGTYKPLSQGHVQETEMPDSIATLKGGLGAVKTVSEKGSNILIPSNSRIGLIFDQPITLGAR